MEKDNKENNYKLMSGLGAKLVCDKSDSIKNNVVNKKVHNEILQIEDIANQIKQSFKNFNKDEL